MKITIFKQPVTELPTYKIVSTQYSNNGAGKLVGQTVTLYARQTIEGTNEVLLIFKAGTGKKFMTVSCQGGKINMKNADFYECAYHSKELGFTKSDWSKSLPITCTEYIRIK